MVSKQIPEDRQSSNTLPVPTRKQMMAIISSMPDMFVSQFFKISAFYQGFQAMVSRLGKLNGRGRYINECERSMMMLHNMIAMASNGHPIEKQVYNDVEKAKDALSSAYTYYSSWTRPVFDADKEIVNNESNDDVPPLEIEINRPDTIIAEDVEDKPIKKNKNKKKKSSRKETK